MITKLTPEELKILNSTNSKMFKYLVLPLLGLLIIILILSSSFENKGSATGDAQVQVKLTTNK
jgi:hypothetical protein